jgi:pyruvate,water dikinase
MLIEIARRAGNYLPDLSFGTHFFQDLVESGIRYLPLYPDEPDVVFNEALLRRSPNLLASMLPEYAHLDNVLRVVDVPAAANGRLLQVLMNADLGRALGILTTDEETGEPRPEMEVSDRQQPPQFWRWRLRMAERIAADLDPEQFGVKAMYVFGSTKNANASPRSDIDLLVHVTGDPQKQQLLLTWLEGWSRCLADLNYLHTGYDAKQLLDVHLVTDEQVARHEGFAAKINAVTDAARPLALGTNR